MRKTLGQFFRCTAGTALVETALIMPFLVLLLAAVINFSQVYEWRSENVGIASAGITAIAVSSTEGYNRYSIFSTTCAGSGTCAPTYDFNDFEQLAIIQATLDYGNFKKLGAYPEVLTRCTDGNDPTPGTDDYKSSTERECAWKEGDHMIFHSYGHAQLEWIPFFGGGFSLANFGLPVIVLEVDGPIRTRLVK